MNSAITTLGTPAANDVHPELAPGLLSRLTAGYIREAAGIPVTEDDDCLIPQLAKKARATHGGEWELTVDDQAYLTAYFYPRTGADSDPAWIAAIATALLTGAPAAGSHQPGPVPAETLGLKAAAGHHLRQQGFPVQINVYPDNDSLQFSSDVSATLPVTDDDPDGTAIVYISDNGIIVFERSYWWDHATWESAPQLRSWLPDPTAPARAIATTITAAVGTAHPALAAR